MFTANSSKNPQNYCQPIKNSICYNIPLHTHDEDHFHHPQTLNLLSGIHTECILNGVKKHDEVQQKMLKNYYKDRMFNSK